MKTKSKNTKRAVLGCLSILTICLMGLCVIGIFAPEDDPAADQPTLPMDVVISNTATAAREATLTTIAPLPTLSEPATPTSFIVPAVTLFQSASNIAAIPGASCVPQTTPQTGTVVDVVDGDTIKVSLDGVTYSVRYIGMDTPESTIQHEPYGKEASEKNAELVMGKKVTLFKDVSETDKYDRLLRYVFTDSMFVNYELVKQGYANAVTYPPDVACADMFREAEANARINFLGLWALQSLATATSPGGATQSVIIVAVNKSAEYVDIKNIGSTPINLQGWTLVSERGNQRCGLSGILEPGQTLRIWAGTESSGYSCGFGTNIWNNSESDPAVLFDAQGHEVDRR